MSAGVAVPNRTERIIRTIMHVVATITMILASIVLMMVLLTLARVGQAIERIDPGPGATGCPFGDLECGG